MNTSDIQKTIQSGLEGAMKQLQAEASSLMNTSLDGIASSFPDATQQFFSQANPNTITAANVDKQKGPKETEHKVKTLAADSSEAVSNPVAFITKPIDDAVKGTDVTTMGQTVKDALADMDSNVLSNISKSTGLDISSSSDLMSAVNSVTSDFAGSLGDSSFPNSLSSTLESVTSSISEYGGSLMSGVNSALNSVTDATQFGSDILNMDIINDFSSALPTPLNDMLGSLDTGAISDKLDGLVGDKLSSVTNILNQLEGITSTDNLFEMIEKLGDSSLYSSLTGSDGSPLDALFGNNSKANVSQIYEVANSICPGIGNVDTVDYRKNKDLYDTLLQAALDLGLTDLFTKLVGCSGSSNDYYDSRSENLMKAQLSDSAKYGNSDIYKAVQAVIGPYNVIDAEGDIIKLIANSEDTPSNVKNIHDIADNAHLNLVSLYQTEELNQSIISASMVGLLSSTNTSIISESLDNDNRKLIMGAQLTYA